MTVIQFDNENNNIWKEVEVEADSSIERVQCATESAHFSDCKAIPPQDTDTFTHTGLYDPESIKTPCETLHCSVKT